MLELKVKKFNFISSVLILAFVFMQGAFAEHNLVNFNNIKNSTKTKNVKTNIDNYRSIKIKHVNNAPV